MTVGSKTVDETSLSLSKARYLILWHRLTMRSSALQPWKGQLTGIGYSTAVQASSAHCPRNGLWTRSYAARYTMPPVSHARPLPHNPCT